MHESGSGHFDAKTRSLGTHEIPTITVVDDTFEKHRQVMGETIARAKERGVM